MTLTIYKSAKIRVPEPHDLLWMENRVAESGSGVHVVLWQRGIRVLVPWGSIDDNEPSDFSKVLSKGAYISAPRQRVFILGKLHLTSTSLG